MSGEKKTPVIFVKYLVATVFLVGLTLMMGCGDNDLLDEPTTRYSAYVIPHQNSEDTYEIDAVFGNLCPPGEIEPIRGMYGHIFVNSDASGQPFTIEGYRVNFRNNFGKYTEATTGLPEALNDLEMPTLLADDDLNNLHYDYSTPVITAGDEWEQEGILIWPHGNLEFYMYNLVASQPYMGQIIPLSGVLEQYTSDFVYDLRLTFECRTAATDETFEIETPWTPVHFLDVDNCETP